MTAAPQPKLGAPTSALAASHRGGNSFLPEQSTRRPCGGCLRRLGMSAGSRPEAARNRFPSERAPTLRTLARPVEICNASARRRRPAIRRQYKHLKTWADSCRQHYVNCRLTTGAAARTDRSEEVDQTPAAILDRPSVADSQPIHMSTKATRQKQERTGWVRSSNGRHRSGRSSNPQHVCGDAWGVGSPWTRPVREETGSTAGGSRWRRSTEGTVAASGSR